MADWGQLLARESEAIEVRVEQQRLDFYQNGQVVRSYPVSTAAAGLGTLQDSECTPPGLHRVSERIGDGLSVGAVLKGRRATDEIARIEREPIITGEDLICTRILWLEGAEPANSSPGNNSKERYIYIHGTPEEGLLGKPVSHGCIRMANADVIELYDLVPEGTWVMIRPD